MRLLRLAALCSTALAFASVSPSLAATTIEQEFRYEAGRLKLDRQGDATTIAFRGGAPDLTPGRPEMPLLAEPVTLPPGMSISAVQVVALETEPVADHVRLATTAVIEHGIGPVQRTAPDPMYFSRAGFQPEQAVSIGAQGWLRGRNVAYLKVSPVRWDAQSGRLERVTRVRVRLTLAPSATRPLQRLRVVSEWEDDPVWAKSLAAARTPTPLSAGPSRRPEAFSATQIPSLLGSPVQYVIITNDALAGEFQRLADWKTKSGVPAVVRTLSFIQQQYPQGSDDAERIRDFIQDAYTRWGAKWVLLGGDTEIIPTRLARTSYNGGEDIACDMYYSCLDGNWDANGNRYFGEGNPTQVDSVDFFPEVYVGRAPVASVADVKQFVDKTFQYTRTPVGDYENSLLFFAEVLFPENWVSGQPIELDGASLSEELLTSIHTDPDMRYARLYQNYTNTAWEPGALTETREAVLDSLNKGYGISVHIGHGYRNVMSVATGNLYNSDALALTNGNRLTNLYAINCTSNAIDFPCIGEAFLHAQNGGAVTSVGSTRFDFPYAGRYYEQEFFKAVFVDGYTAIGEAQARQKLPLVQFSDYDNAYRWMQFTLLELGDPELRIWSGLPKNLTVTHNASMPLSDTTFAVHVEFSGSPLANARVTAYKVGDDYQVGQTDGSGNLTLKFRPDTLGTFSLTVITANARPYEATINVTAAPALPVLADATPVIDDDAVGGTTGDADGIWDVGEIVDLRVPLRNNGTATANAVSATLSTTDGLVTITSPTLSYGTLAPGALVTPFGAFRITLPFTAPDQREVPFTLSVSDGLGRKWTRKFSLTARAPQPRHVGHTITDNVNNNGVPELGESVTYQLRFRNMGTGDAHQVSAVLRDHDGLATVTDSTTTLGALAPAEEKLGDPLVFTLLGLAAKLELRVSDEFGLLYTQTLDVVPPDPTIGLTGFGQATSIKLTWFEVDVADLYGYNVYRSTSSGGPFTRINAVPTDRIAYYLDSGLSPLTRFFYRVTVVDSSLNESAPSATISTSTNPPLHTVFPIPMFQATFAPVAVDHFSSGYPLDIVAGNDVLYVWHADGTALHDADGAGSTNGDYSTRGTNFEGGGSIADLDGDNVKELIGIASDSTQVFVFDQAGNAKPGWPRKISDGAWSSAAIADLDNDGQKEIVFGTNGTNFYAFHANGTELIDGDANPTTIGVFKVLGAPYNFGTPVLVDLDNNGQKDIVYGSFDGKLYAWRPNGTNLPGFPILLPNAMTASCAVGFLDGPSDTQYDIVAVTGSLTTHTGPDSVYVFSNTGVKRPGWPKFIRTSNNNKTPSPALADMNHDGFLDIVIASTNGTITVFDRTGAVIAPWNAARYSPLTSSASEASPVVADIDGDGSNDIVMGDEQGNLNALSGLTATPLPGFPLTLGAEVKSAAALCDCDGDGKTEIVVSGWDKNTYVWDYDFPFSPGGPPPWPQFHHDALRTGLSTAPVFVGVDEPQVPADTRTLELAAPMPNPSRGTSRLWYAVPADRVGQPLELGVYDLAGRSVRTLARGTAMAGRHSAAWDLNDASGARVGPGVYFIQLRIGGEGRSQKFVVLN